MTKREDQVPLSPKASVVVARTLKRAIIAGRYRAGECLPTERELADRHGVSRQSIREALGQLQAVGLVEIRRSSGCYVQDIRNAAGLELLDDLLGEADGRIAIELVDEVIEFGSSIAREVVKLAATRRSDEDVDQLHRIVAEHAGAFNDPDRLSELNGRFCRIVAAAARNRIYQLVFNSLGRAFERIRRDLPLFLLDPAGQHKSLERMVEAIAEKDADLAALYLDRLANSAKGVLAQFLRGTVEGQEAGG